jgi:hypothetical protein
VTTGVFAAGGALDEHATAIAAIRETGDLPDPRDARSTG